MPTVAELAIVNKASVATSVLLNCLAATIPVPTATVTVFEPPVLSIMNSKLAPAPAAFKARAKLVAVGKVIVVPAPEVLVIYPLNI